MLKRARRIKLGSDRDHTRSMVRNLATSLIMHEAIKTTKTRAKAVVPFVERLITVLKREDSLAKKRIVFERLGNKEAAQKLITDILPRMQDRNSGYFRTVKSANMKGDNSLSYHVLFVDFEPKKRTPRTKGTKKQESKPKQDKQGGGFLDRVRNLGGQQKSQNETKVAETQKKSHTSRSGI